MPLSFHSKSHGDIAFGFFNIESDMLLLNDYFFFADTFCEWIIEMSQSEDTGLNKVGCHIYQITDPSDIGDLMGAIHGIRFEGFIGEIYKLFPFPKDPQAFKQNPEGYLNQEVVRAQIQEVSNETRIYIEFRKNREIQIGSYIFDLRVFHELIRYVWQGGYPNWKNGIRPQYVIEMKKNIQKSSNSYFKGVFL